MESIQKHNYLLIAVKVVIALFAIMYIKSGYDIISTHEISFVNFKGESNGEMWVARNLGIRILAIGIGMVVALMLRNNLAISTTLFIRLVADTGDLINSVFTEDLADFIVPTLGVIVGIELICFLLMLKLIKQQNIYNGK